MHFSFTGVYIDQNCFQEVLYGLNGADPGKLTDYDIVHVYISDELSSYNSSLYSDELNGRRLDDEMYKSYYEQRMTRMTSTDDIPSQPSYIFSAQRGLLSLPPSSRKKYNISSALYLLPYDSADKCFQMPYLSSLRFLIPMNLMKYVFGYDTIILNLMRRLSYDSGYLYVEHRRRLLDLNFYSRFVFSVATMNSFGNPLLWDDLSKEAITNSSHLEKGNCVVTEGSEWSGSTAGLPEDVHFLTALRDKLFLKLSIVITATFLFFALTSMVSFILKQTQSRMLKFTFLLQYHVRNHIPYSSLVFVHVFESLIFVPIMLGE